MIPEKMHDGGFVDVHVHIEGDEGIESVLSTGVSAIRNAGMRANRARQRDPGRRRTGRPIVISSCWALCKLGGYGTAFGAPLDTRDEIKKEILKLKKAGADIIKVMASGMVSLKNPGAVTTGGFDRGDLRFIVEEAGLLGFGVMAHANTERAITAAAESGVRSVEHGFFMTARALDSMARNGTFWTPTVGALVRAAQKTGGTREQKQFVSGLVNSHLQMLNRAYSIGVPLALGTDCVLPDPRYREAYEEEVSYFVQAGIPQEEVARIAREGGARLLGLL